VLTALPADTSRSRTAELGGSMLLAVLFSLLGAVLWSTALGRGRNSTELFNLFFMTVGASWAVLIPAKFWNGRSSTWSRRVVMLGLGAVVGLEGFWLHGESLRPSLTPFVDMATGAPVQSEGPAPFTREAGYLAYYALAFFALRWWRMTDRRRMARFSFAPVLAATFWGLLLTLVGPSHEAGWGANASNVLVLVMTAAVVQMVSPWEQPPPPAAKRIRLRCA
jgi:hypothetical protein